MLVLSLRQNGFRRIESLLSSSDRAIIAQRMVQTRKFNTMEPPPAPPSFLTPGTEVSVDTRIPKRADSLWKVGARVSAAGGVENTVTNAASIRANSFIFYLKSPYSHTWQPITPHSISEFKKRMKQYGYANNMVSTNGSFIINLGNPDSARRRLSFECLLDDMQKCEALDLELYNFSPGSSVNAMPIESSLTFIADCINWAHRATRTVTLVLRNTARSITGSGSKFSDLARIIAEVKDKKRVGICLDTCSAFASGYDFRTKEGWDATMSEFDKEIGLNYLRGVDLSDSKALCNSMKILRQNIGLGHLGITAFQHILQDPRTQNIPLYLMTPSFQQPEAVWGKEIEVLQALTTPSVIKSEDLRSLVDGIMNTVQEAKSTPKKQERVVKSTEITNSDVGSAESCQTAQTFQQNELEWRADFWRKQETVVKNTELTNGDVGSAESCQMAQTSQQNEPELPAKKKLPSKWSRNVWRNYQL